jgi:hypothetical protein
MPKKIVSVLAVLGLMFIIGCSQPVQQDYGSDVPVNPEPAEDSGSAAMTGSEEIDQVASGVSDIDATEQDLDLEDLEDLDTILEDIENI